MPMDKIIKLNDSIGLTIEALSDKKYTVWTTNDGEEDNIFFTVDNKAITEFTKSAGRGKELYNFVKNNIKIDFHGDVEKYNDELTHEFKRIQTELEQLRVKSLANFVVKSEEDIDEEIDEHLQIELQKMEEKYPKEYIKFEDRCKLYNFSPLQFVCHVTQGLGVGLTREVIKAFFGYFQTYIGFKGTNVIAVGSQTSGKSHILETALSFIPDERVHIGVKTPAYFFRKYNHMDLTGHIFYLGDLGGTNDNQNTIEMRDILKELSTDGYVSRGIVDDDNPEEQWVKGYPCLSYTTAYEEIINSQERSRSMIITPPDVDPYRLMTYKSIMRSPGDYSQTIYQVKQDRESIKGLVYHVKTEQSFFDLFNPYMYNIVDMLGDMEDFNRKIDEFDGILGLCCVLNKCKAIKHTFIDEDFKDVEKPLLIASEQDVYNAYSIFDNTTGLLPTETALINGLIKKFKPYKLDEMPLNMDKDYENSVKKALDVNLDTKEVNWRDESQVSFFTEDSIRREFGNQRWYRKNREELGVKLSKLYMNNFLIKVGTDNKKPVYSLNYNMTKSQQSMKLNFGDKEDDNIPKEEFKKGNVLKYKPVLRAKKIFRENFSDCYDEFEEFVDNDLQQNIQDTDFYVDKSDLYNLPW